MTESPFILTRVHPKVYEDGMDKLIGRALSGPDADCPDCKKRGKFVAMYRDISPDHIEYPDNLIVTVGRY